MSFNLGNKKNTSILILTTITVGFQFLSSTLVTIILTHYFSPEVYALYSFPLIFYSFGFTIINFGFSASIVRNIAKLKNSQETNEMKSHLIAIGFFWKLIIASSFSVLLYILSGTIEKIYNFSGIASNIRIFAIFLFFSSIVAYFEYVFQGLRNFKLYALSNMSFSLIKLLIIVIGFFYGMEIYSFLFKYALISCIQCLIIILFLQKKIKFLNYFVHLNKKISRELFIVSIPAFFVAISNFVLLQFNQLILGLYVDTSGIAHYSVTLMLINLFSTFVLIFSISTLPMITHSMHSEKSKENLTRIFNFILKYGLVITIPLSTFCFFYSSNIVLLIFGQSYLSVAGYFRIFVFYMNFKIISVSGINFLYAENTPKLIIKIIGLTALSSLILSLLLIPHLLIMGAIISIMIPEIISAFIIMFLVKRRNKFEFESRIFVKIFLICISVFISYFLTFLISKLDFFTVSKINFIILFGLFVLVYLILIYLMKIINFKDFFKYLKEPKINDKS